MDFLNPNIQLDINDSETIFTKIYDKHIWGKNKGSGKGSSILYNKKYITFLEQIIHHPNNNIKKIVDIGCGDWQFSKIINFKDKSYLGIDCVKNIIDTNNTLYKSDNITFQHLDIHKLVSLQTIQNADLIIIKDVLQHWDDHQIILFLDYLIENIDFKYILIINGWKQDADKTRCIDNRYCYSKLNAEVYPLNRYNPEVLFYYQFKQVSVIKKNNIQLVLKDL
tara:strand:+ start:949 stop:1617 length:669 start_codon:yes stop_codon:yes gene_type:complete